MVNEHWRGNIYGGGYRGYGIVAEGTLTTNLVYEICATSYTPRIENPKAQAHSDDGATTFPDTVFKGKKTSQLMGASAVDIITYVGVPLAVLGVIPTLYTCLKSLLTLSEIRKLLDRNGVAAITRSSLLSGIIEVEIPRKSIIPLEREDPPYFEISDSVSSLKGGSWTLLNWRELSIGVKSYRFQYHDELCQPQAETEFEHLIAYLLDLGAVPCVEGFSDLRNSGLWTPAGTKLMLSPCTSDAVLSVTTSEDSDGILALTMNWRSEWNKRGINDLPPYWMRLDPPVEVISTSVEEDVPEKKDEKTTQIEGPEKPTEKLDAGPSTLVAEKSTARRSSYSKSELVNPFIQDHDASSFLGPAEGEHKRSISMISFRPAHDEAIRLRLGAQGLEEASYEDMPKKKLRLPHLRAYHNEPNPRALWFACAVTALGAPQGGLWAFGIPEDIVAFSTRESIPGGSMVLMDLISEDAVPTWRTPYDDKMEKHEAWVQQQKKLQLQMEEMKLTPQERTKRWLARQHSEHFEREAERKRKELEAEQKLETDIKEALSSQRMGMAAVADACRQWLIKQQHALEGEDVGSIVERILWEMVKSEEMARAIAEMLDAWKSWAEGGGMTKMHFERAKEDRLIFAYAACVLYSINQASGSAAGRVVSDLQECLRMWRKVRLG
jgi:hypothetical protein